MKDRNGKDISAGERIIWSERGDERTGTVKADVQWNGGLRVGGRSLNNIRDNADWIQVVG